MLCVSILTSERRLDPELWAVIWQARAPDDLVLHGAYNLAGNKRVFVWEAASEAALQFMDVFNDVGVLETFPAFDRSAGWRAAFDGDVEAFRKTRYESAVRRGIASEEVEEWVEHAVALRQKAHEAPTREAARRVARDWVKEREGQ